LYRQYWKLDRKPFENTPDPEFFFPSEEHTEALGRLEYVVSENKGAALLTGDYGCGKTMLIRKIAESVPEDKIDVAYLNNPRWAPEELLQDILFQLGDESIPNNTLDLGRRIGDILFRNTQNGRDTLIIIDEAQLIRSESVLEELRLLLNFQLNDRFMVSMLMSGQPELRERVMAIPQLEQRMFIKCHLHTFDLVNTRKYITHRLAVIGREQTIFTDDSIETIYRHSFGTPRRINNICDLSLLAGFQKGVNKIDGDFIKSLI
jgi:general secretion pathway protein A